MLMVPCSVVLSTLPASTATATASCAGCNHGYDGSREAVLEDQTASSNNTAPEFRFAFDTSIAEVHKERRCSGYAVVADHVEAIVYQTGFEHHSRRKALSQITVTVHRVVVEAIVYKRRESWQAEKSFQANVRARE